MEIDDTKNLYEVRDPQDEYDGSRDEFPHRPIAANIKINDQINSPKWPWIIVIGFLVVIVFILVILLGVNGVTLTHLNTLPVCDNSNPAANTGGLTSGGGSTSNGQSLPNCSVVYTTWADELAQNNTVLRGQISQMNWAIQNQVGRLLNMTRDTAWKVDGLGAASDDNMAYIQNISDVLSSVLQTTGDSAQKLTNIVNTLSNLRDTSISTAGVIDDILLVVNDLLSLQNASALLNSITPVSCADIKRAQPNSPSGYYHVNSRNIYCNMGELCGSGGGWTRLAYLDMSDAAQNCPTGFRYYQTGAIRACGRTSTSASCVSATYPTNGINYTQICGRVIGYQKGSTDAVNQGPQHNNLNSYYLDGVSITRGFPREHVWSLMSGVWENRVHNSDCPCNTGINVNVQSFIGNNYYCESGNPNQNWVASIYTADPLWDGQQCRNLETPCCNNPNLPWFNRNYGNVSSSASLELRVCGDEGWQNEDNPISFYEIYVK